MPCGRTSPLPRCQNGADVAQSCKVAIAHAVGCCSHWPFSILPQHVLACCSAQVLFGAACIQHLDQPYDAGKRAANPLACCGKAGEQVHSNYSGELGASSKCRCYSARQALQRRISMPGRSSACAQKCRLQPCDTIARALEQMCFSLRGTHRHRHDRCSSSAPNALPAAARAGDITSTALAF